MNTETIGDYLIRRLYEAGVQHIFGVPGDYVLGFYDLLVKSQIKLIGTTREDTAAFAADGYARCQGLGALAVTYGVGALSTVNAVAGAFAESSPVVVISGAPGVIEQRDDPLLHHRFGPFNFQREIFERITCATVVLDDPLIAFRQIDRAIAAAKSFYKPIYIEIPRDQLRATGFPIPIETTPTFVSDETALAEAVAESLELISQAISPIIMAGIELHRRGLQNALVDFVEKANFPVVATLSGKSVMAERHPLYLGIYEGAMSSENARYMVEQSDLLLMLGVTLTDIDTGIYTAHLDQQRTIRAAQNEVTIRSHRYPRVAVADFLTALTNSAHTRALQATIPASGLDISDFPQPETAMTIARLIARLNKAITPEFMVVCDVGDCLFAAIDLQVHEQSEFFASAFYTSMGFAVPAALGAQIARPEHRALILVGDGAFQMTGTELSTHARYGLAPIVIVFNNQGYSTERGILEGSFNDISLWRFDRFGEVFGPLTGYDATTETAFEHALLNAINDHNAPSIINVHLTIGDASSAMQRLSAHLKSRLSGAS